MKATQMRAIGMWLIRIHAGNTTQICSYWRNPHRLVAASLLATCNTTLPLLMFLKTDMASEWDIPWSASPFTARTSSPAERKSVIFGEWHEKTRKEVLGI